MGLFSGALEDAMISPPTIALGAGKLLVAASVVFGLLRPSIGLVIVNQPQKTPNGAAQTPAGALVGRVVAASDGQALAEATVRVTPVDGHASRTVSTDRSGKFTCSGMSPGRYVLSANKKGYLARSYGQSTSGLSPTVVELREDDRVAGIEIRLPEAATITGVVTDADGAPLVGVRIDPRRPLMVLGRRRIVPVAAGASTDAGGEFRISELEPGRYYVIATPSLAQSRTTGKQRTGLAQTYFPGSQSIDGAQLLELRAGETRTLYFSLPKLRLYSVSGFVWGADGPAAVGQSLNVNGPDGAPRLAIVGKGGEFRVDGLAPGQYAIQTRSRYEPGMVPSISFAIVTVSDADVSDILVGPVTAATITGRVIASHGDSALGELPRTAIQVTVVPMSEQGVATASLPTKVNDDLTVEVNAWPGLQRLHAQVRAPGWFVQGITLDGRDIRGENIQIGNGQRLEGLEVLLTDRPTRVVGSVRHFGKEDGSGSFVVVFPVDTTHWDRAYELALKRLDPQSRFSVEGLPPGRYYVVAVDTVDAANWSAPELLEKLAASAESFTIAEAETKILTVKPKTR